MLRRTLPVKDKKKYLFRSFVENVKLNIEVTEWKINKKMVLIL